ncbi:MAG: hypothetical protein K0U93_28305 [Gammaproteobacteria bacterium]|nr:hypothetical protein [Gammaproteobacteria bacterium]
MSSTPHLPHLGAGHGNPDGSALDHMVHTVRRLVRAERRQVLMHYGLGGLFWGIVGASVAALVIRLMSLQVAVLHATSVCILVGLTVGLSAGWAARRSPMAVAIQADIRLNLKQRLSSAWELFERDSRSPAAAEISQQLLRARLPAQAQRVFPLSRESGNEQRAYPGVRWGRLVPAAALLLLLVSTLDFSQFTGHRVVEADRAVQREGAALRTYGDSLAARARDDGLAASGQMAEAMRRLGRRMEGGTLARGPALERLSELRRDISNSRQRIAPRNLDGASVSHAEKSRARDAIEDAASAVASRMISPSELRNNESLKRALVTANINEEAFRKAVEEAYEGDPNALEKMIEKLRSTNRSARDGQELERAYDRVQRIRENLGAPAEPGSSAAPTSSAHQGAGLESDDDFPEGDADSESGGDSDASNFVFRDRGRPGQRNAAPNASQSEAPTAPQGEEELAVRPKGKLGQGQELAAQTRAAPRVGTVSTPMQDTSPQQRQRVEAILSKDSLPAHQKAYVRRYFLELSRGVSAAPSLAREPSK